MRLERSRVLTVSDNWLHIEIFELVKVESLDRDIWIDWNNRILDKGVYPMIE